MSLENQKKKKMDMSKASRGIWLVKVPNYVAQMWEQAPNDMQVATMRMEKSGDDKEPAKKDDGKRRKDATKVLSKENIMDMLFQAFEKHQYYTLKDLQFITKQSVFVLKAILKDIGDYSKDPAHRQMWELKEEYRHYQKPESETK
ncbi:general transcription factor IIF subunit 2 isoform X2 [Drosophila virilis]|uniref:General transcription factor IIF subunit 2 n=1 Tax=Drosophila virilis TaxID=7244 RepID=A0A0Q9WAR6_DROVI|nr:general transcription factor IIF subunit 2 isoform X2 [Drosophila virilis]KRF79319.1 uncharacterized protein Dvir_GJ21374, isoform B [Drosophila virilis]